MRNEVAAWAEQEEAEERMIQREADCAAGLHDMEPISTWSDELGEVLINRCRHCGTEEPA